MTRQRATARERRRGVLANWPGRAAPLPPDANDRRSRLSCSPLSAPFRLDSQRLRGRASGYPAAAPRRRLAGPVLPRQWLLLAGARPEELRVLTRSHLHLSNDPPLVKL